MKPECPLTMQEETKQSPQHGHQRANTMHTSSQSKASKTKDRKGQPNFVIRPTQMEKTGEPQEQKCHKEILSVHIDDTQKSTYNAKVGSTEATALFDSGDTLSCISK